MDSDSFDALVNRDGGHSENGDIVPDGEATRHKIAYNERQTEAKDRSIQRSLVGLIVALITTLTVVLPSIVDALLKHYLPAPK